MKKLQDPGLSVPRIYSRFVTFKYINSHSAFAIQSIFYLFSDHTTSPFPFTRHWLLFFLTSFATITFVAYCIPFYVYALLSSTLWNVIACSSLDSMVL